MYARIGVLFSLIVVTLASTSLFAQHRLNGVVRDHETGEALLYANIRIENTQVGTTSDREGRFTLPLPAGEHVIIVSYIGYHSSRKHVVVPHSETLEIRLRPMVIEMQEVTVTPGDNPALRIIRKAIEMKEVQREKLHNYSLVSHSKLVMRMSGLTFVDASGTNQENASTVTIESTTPPSETTSADSAGVEKRDSRIPVILETQTEAFWARPNKYKEIVTARKQSAFIPPQVNIIISKFFITDFSRDELNFGDKAPIVGPISHRGLNSYYYRLVTTTAIDSTTIYHIEISPLRDSDPLLEGSLYIAEGSYSLAMVDLRLNRAALPTLLDTLAFRQNFSLIDNEFWMPADVIVDASINVDFYLINFTIDVEGFSVLQNYRINQQINEDFFDRTVIKVLKEADERDSIYWSETQIIPNTEDEIRAYVVSDSIKHVMDSTQYLIGFGDVFTGGLTGSDAAQFRFPGVFSLYEFNRVQGHALSGEFSLTMRDAILRRAVVGMGYGFSDHRWKYHVTGTARLLTSPSLDVVVSRYMQLDHIDSEIDPLMNSTVTMLSWFGNYDYRDYFYRDGWSVELRYDPWLLFPMNIQLTRDSFINATKNSDWSLFRRDVPYRDNPPINEGTIFGIRGRISVDARNILDNAGRISRIGPRNHIPALGAGWYRASLEGRIWDIRTFTASLDGRFDLGLYGVFSYDIDADAAKGALPTQMLFNLQGSIDYLASGSRFRTLDFREFGGDTRVIAAMSYDFRDWLFRWLRVPLLRDSGWGFELFTSGGWSTMTDETRAWQTIAVHEAKRVFWEAGFGLKGILGIFRIDVAWRLNHFRKGRNVYIGLGSSILF